MLSPRINAEQLYKIWKTEIECLDLLDIRSLKLFSAERIPSSKRIEIDEIGPYLDGSIDEKAYILISEKGDQDFENILKDHPNILILEGGLQAWKECGFPVSPFSENKREELLSSQNSLSQNKESNRSEAVVYDFNNSSVKIIFDENYREGILIDPLKSLWTEIATIIKNRSLNIRYVLFTGVEDDEFINDSLLRNINAKTCMSVSSKIKGADIYIDDGQELSFGDSHLTTYLSKGSKVSYFLDISSKNGSC